MLAVLRDDPGFRLRESASTGARLRAGVADVALDRVPQDGDCQPPLRFKQLPLPWPLVELRPEHYFRFEFRREPP